MMPLLTDVAAACGVETAVATAVGDLLQYRLGNLERLVTKQVGRFRGAVL
jgi:hypothetical protein